MTTQVSSNQIVVRKPLVTLNGVLWALQTLWGFFFAGSGFGKVLLYDAELYAGAPQVVAWYAAVSQPLIVVIGACEVLGGVGLILPALTRVRPRLTVLAAAGLALTMLLAAVFHLARGEFALVPVNLVLGGVAAFLAAARTSRRPITPGPLTRRGVLISLAVLTVMVLTTIIPTWFSMTQGRF